MNKKLSKWNSIENEMSQDRKLYRVCLLNTDEELNTKVWYWTVTNWSMNQGPLASSIKHYCFRLGFERHQVRNLVETLTTLNFSPSFSVSPSNTWVVDPETLSLLIRWPPYQARQVSSAADTMTKNRWLSPVPTDSNPPEARAFPHHCSKQIKLVGAFASWWIIRSVFVCVCVCVRARSVVWLRLLLS